MEMSDYRRVRLSRFSSDGLILSISSLFRPPCVPTTPSVVSRCSMQSSCIQMNTALVTLLCCVGIECVLVVHACVWRDCYGTLVAYTMKNYH